MDVKTICLALMSKNLQLIEIPPPPTPQTHLLNASFFTQKGPYLSLQFLNHFFSVTNRQAFLFLCFDSSSCCSTTSEDLQEVV